MRLQEIVIPPKYDAVVFTCYDCGRRMVGKENILTCLSCGHRLEVLNL